MRGSTRKKSQRKPHRLFRGKFLELLHINGWEFARRVGDTQAVGIIAVTPDDKLLLISQYRVPVARTVIEIPAGLLGDGPGGNGEESWKTAAKRELQEETGWQASSIEWLTEGPSSAGLTSECQALVRARGLKRAGPQQLQDEENITVHEIPLKKIDAWLRAKQKSGTMIDPKVWAALYFLRSDSR